MRAETSDAADPGGARVSRGGRRSHPQQHPPRPSPPPRGSLGAASLHLPRTRTAGSYPQEVWAAASQPRRVRGALSARPSGRGTRGDGERCAGLGAPGRRASVRGPAAVPSALRIPQVMGTRAGSGNHCRLTAPSFGPSARSHPGTPPAPFARPPELLPLPWLPSSPPLVASC